MSNFFATHCDTIQKACETILTREYWSAYPEAPSTRVYGDNADTEGQTAFEARLNCNFELANHPSDNGRVGEEVSPYGLKLNIKYPAASVEQLVRSSTQAQTAWAKASVEERTGIALEILHRLNKQSFQIAHAIMHTTGQAFAMSFQAGGAHAQDRGLEAVAYAYEEMQRIPAQTTWIKPQGKRDPITMEKTFTIRPRGISLVIGCATFPTWNSYPGLFASLVTGNTVIVKPHPSAVLPLGLTVETCRQVLTEAGFDPNVVLLAADEAGSEITKDLISHDDVKIIDFTGSSSFGQWVRQKANADKQVYTEESGVNSIVIGSTDNFKGMCSNIAFSLSLYSGQMCTTPQNVYVPESGIQTNEGHKTSDEVATGIANAVNALLGDDDRAAAICGAIANPNTLERIKQLTDKGLIVRETNVIGSLPNGRTATPLILKISSSETNLHHDECFGPVAFIITTESTTQAIHEAASLALSKGAITASVYATDEKTLGEAEDAFHHAGVNLSCNLTESVYVNQSAAFSDYHVTGANPAGNASLSDTAFVANRFRVVSVRSHKTE